MIRSVGVAALVMLGAVTVAPQQSTAAPRVAQQCSGMFQATVRQGPDRGPLLKGTLRLMVQSSGGLTGTLRGSAGSNVALVGEAHGRAINLYISLGPGKNVFGVGTSAMPVAMCEGPMGGPFVGPRAGDTGDWGYGISG